ncbi:MAG: exodeoxyribonuclease [Pseudomonadota bacterium]
MPTIKCATWNINGVKARLDGLKTWLKETSPDLACLQEIKSVDEQFPREDVEALGYRVETHGQKGFNGVAILSRLPLDDIARGLPGDETDLQSRYISALATCPSGRVLRVGGLYLPNGNPTGTEKTTYKWAWMRRLIEHAGAALKAEEPLLLMGDYNVIPEPVDAKQPDLWVNDALFLPETRALYRELLALGFTDALRVAAPGKDVYTFWDYQAGAFQKNNGIRIDHILASPQAADLITGAGVDQFTRGWEKPSDHAPVWVTLDL